MRRSPALHSLSREHHQALVIAKRLTTGTTDDWDRFVAEDLLPHFAVEEEALLGLLEQLGGQAHARRLVDEHLALRQLYETRQAAAFGRLLHDHVRYEERELFPWLEAQADLPVLASPLAR